MLNKICMKKKLINNKGQWMKHSIKSNTMNNKWSFLYNKRYYSATNILDGTIEINDQSKKNEESMTNKINYLRGLVDKVKLGGNKQSIKNHISKGKLLPRDRVDKLIDFGSPFLEFSQLASHNIDGEDYPAASLITGIGKIKGTECMIVANDSTIKGGTYFPLTVKKHLRAQEIAEKMKLPCIYIVDSSGINISHSRTFPDKENFGKILHNQAQMSAKGIPQVSIVCGTCSGSGAYITSMADETVIVKDSHIFLSGPHLVEITTGEKVTHNELGSAEMHSKISGLTDHLADNEYEAFQVGRNIIENLNVKKSTENPPINSVPPLYPIDDIYSLIPDSLSKPLNMRAVLARLLDGSRFDEFKKFYGETIICGFARIHGHLVGILANNGITFSESAMKATHFLQLCDQRRVPLVCLHNTTGFITGKDYERQGITKHMANLVQTISCISVPKFTVVMGNSFGAGNYIGGTDPHLLFLWPNARLGVMENQVAADLLTHIRSEKMRTDGKEWSREERKKFRDPIAEQLENQGSAIYSTARIWDDGVIDPRNTRQILGLVLSSLSNDFSPMKSYGVLRL